MASKCICKEEAYFCIGCYSTYASREGFQETCCCWLLGYDWSKIPLSANTRNIMAGGGCFAGLACILFGDSTEKFYSHQDSKNICETYTVYCPCGTYSSVKTPWNNHLEIEVKTPCCGYEYTHELKKKDTISGSAKARIVPQPQQTNESL